MKKYILNRIIKALLVMALAMSVAFAIVLTGLAVGVIVPADYSNGERSKIAALNTESLLTPVPGSGCVINNEEGFIYGLAQGFSTLVGYVNVASGYELAYVPTENGFGTGTVVNVINGGVAESYTIVIFGDVSGDGNIDSTDAGKIVDYENYIKTWNPTDDAAYLMASNINADSSRDSLDAGIIIDFENHKIGINQTTGVSYSSIITFDSAGGTTVTSVTGHIGDSVLHPADPAKTGYSFTGWLPAIPAAFTGGNVTVIAQWSVKKYTITFNSDGGSTVEGITQDYNTSITAPANPTKAGYTFNGWLPAVPATMPAGNTECVAQWIINKSTITFDSAGGSAIESITQDYATAVTPPIAPVKTGYTFTGWIPAVPTTMPATLTNCVAQWAINYYTITFDANGGTGGQNPSVAFGVMPTPPSVKKLGYALESWSPEIVPATGNVTYMAQWVPYTYVTGDVIDYGSYPQTQVTEPVLITALESEPLSPDNTVIYNGEKYKRVYFTQYTTLEGGYSTDPGSSLQDDNGYYTDTVYWFRFEPVEWRVLSNSNGELLVMADKILSSNQYYDQQYEDVTWETCSLRNWLNNDFYNIAFDSAEQVRIETTALINEDNIEQGTLGGNDTNDKIFLLAQSDAANADYGFNPNFDNPDSTREAVGTDYAKCNGLYVSDDGDIAGNSMWWLRSPGSYQNYASIIDADGYGGRSDNALNAYLGVRPVLRINANT